MSSGETGSYRIGEARFHDASSELERLRIQAELTWAQELAVCERRGLRRDASVLEAGCGPGFVTVRLLEYLEGGSLTALDVDSTMLVHARELVGDDRVRFVEASAASTGLEPASFDVVLARLLLQHVPEVEGAIRELRRVLRAGGRLLVADADFAFSTLFEPEPPFARDIVDAVTRAQRLQGGDGQIGRKLPRLLREAGFREIAVDAVVAHSVVAGREPVRRIVPDQALDYLEAVGLLSRETAEAGREFLARIDSGEQEFEGMLMFLVVSGSA